MNPELPAVPSALPVSSDAAPAETVAPAPKAKRSPLGRILDLAAIAIVLYAVFHFFIAPRMLAKSAAQPAPPVALAAMDGPPFSLAEHRGRIVFLDFWASWCGPCKLSLPLAEHFASTHPKVDVIAIDSGEAPAIAGAYAHEHGLKNVVFDERGQATHAFAVDAYPTMIVIDAKGAVQAKWVGYNPALEDNMASAVAALATPKSASSQ